MVKISDVARHAGVSPSTVSYVLSGKRSISPETKERVWAAIEALGYRAHAGARALASSRSNVVALVLPLRSGIHLPVVMQLAASVVTSAREHDHDVLLLTAQEGEEGLRRVAASSMVDGVLVMDVQMHDERLPALRSLDRPAVLIGMPEDTTGVTCVDLDFTAAGAACVGHLADLGHRRVALIGSPPEVYARETGFAERVERGFDDAGRAAGDGLERPPLCADGRGRRGAHRRAAARPSRPHVAGGAQRTARRAGHPGRAAGRPGRPG